MASTVLFVVSAALSAPVTQPQASMVLVSFDGKSTDRTWKVTNDPVMGGRSESTFTKVNSTGVFDGINKIVPSLDAPGFCNAAASLGGEIDLSAYGYLAGAGSEPYIVITARTTTPDYAGFRLGIGGKDIPKTSIFGGGSFKAGFSFPGTPVPGTPFQAVKIPMGAFSYDWSGFTGACNTKDPARGLDKQHYCCPASGLTPSKPEVCPAPKYLEKVTDIELWAEGVNGTFHLEVSSIAIMTGSTSL